MRILLSLAVLTAPAFAGSHVLDRPVDQGPPNVPEFQPAFPEQTRAPALAAPGEVATEVIASGLEHPWGIAALPDGGYLVTERAGRLRMIGADGQLGAAIEGVPDVVDMQQGGMLDVTVAEDFAETRRVWLTYAKPMGFGRSATAAATGVLSADGARLDEVRDIWVQTPASLIPAHFGSRILIVDGVAWITTGDRFTDGNRVLAQDVDNGYGKVIRVGADGSLPDDNPFAGQGDAAGAVWSLGHRNVQGLAVRPGTGEVWTMEHGPRGGDELNLIAPGGNYGWPVVSYGENYSGTSVGSGVERADGFIEPRYYWDPVIAPGGFVFYDGDLFDWQGDFVGSSLNPGGMVRLTMEGDRVTGEARYLPDVGRVRDVEIAGDGALIVLTDAPDGEVLRVTPR